jgi:hypothetical protein
MRKLEQWMSERTDLVNSKEIGRLAASRRNGFRCPTATRLHIDFLRRDLTFGGHQASRVRADGCGIALDSVPRSLPFADRGSSMPRPEKHGSGARCS